MIPLRAIAAFVVFAGAFASAGANLMAQNACRIGMSELPFIDFGEIAIGDSAKQPVHFHIMPYENHHCTGYVTVEQQPSAPFRVLEPTTVSPGWANSPALTFRFTPTDTGSFEGVAIIEETWEHPQWMIELKGRGVFRVSGVAVPDAAACSVTASSRPGDITFTLTTQSATYAQITIADRLGGTVAVLTAECSGEGGAVLHWPTAGIARGPYLYRVEAAGTVTTGKVVVGE